MVDNVTIVSMLISLAIAVGTPVVLFIIFKKKWKISVRVVLFGMLTFFIFVNVLEGLAHAFFLIGNETTKSWLQNPWLYMLYGGLMAGIFEETGRYVVFKYALKKYRKWKDGLAFGLGHGGVESILLVGLNSIIMIIVAILISQGLFDQLLKFDESLALIKDQLLVTGTPFLILLGGIERLSAIAIHLGLSLLVLFSVKRRKVIYFILAILLHAVFDFPAALYQAGVMENIFIVEMLIALMAIFSLIWIVKSKQLFQREE